MCIRDSKKPAWSNVVTGLELDRRTRWGELYTLDDSTIESIEDHDWLRTAYRYAHAVMKGDLPRIDRAIEYATIDRLLRARGGGSGVIVGGDGSILNNYHGIHDGDGRRHDVFSIGRFSTLD